MQESEGACGQRVAVITPVHKQPVEYVVGSPEQGQIRGQQIVSPGFEWQSLACDHTAAALAAAQG
jgi:hypothetical protein